MVIIEGSKDILAEGVCWSWKEKFRLAGASSLGHKEKTLGGMPGLALSPAMVCPQLSPAVLWQQVPAQGDPRVLPELHCPGPSFCGLQR